jgi:Flp pilus assembly pilin Flp
VNKVRRSMISRAVSHLVADDTGQDLVEYALLSGIIGVAGLLLFPVIAGQMAAAYASWLVGSLAAWEPSAPAGP